MRPPVNRSWLLAVEPDHAGGFSLSIEGDPNPAFSAPNNAARTAEAIGWNDQGELVGNEERCDDLKGGAGIRNVANGAVKCPTAETDRSGFKHAAPRCYSVLVPHRPKLRGAVRIFNRRSTSGGAIQRLVLFPERTAVGRIAQGSLSRTRGRLPVMLGTPCIK